MDNSQKTRKKARQARIKRVRKTVRGNSEKPRLSILKTNQHLYAQIIDDEKGLTIAGFGTQSKGCKCKKRSKEAAKEVGRQIAEIARGKNIEKVVLDRGRYKYHGLIAEFANSAREVGLQF